MTDTWNTFYTGSEENIQTAVAQINTNCGFPDGYTETWAIPIQAYEQDFWFFLMPPPEGYKEPWRSFTQQEMVSGIIGVQEEQGQSSWWPVVPPQEVE